MPELLSRDAAAFEARQAGGLAGTSHPSQLAGASVNEYWKYRTLGSPHGRSPMERRPLCEGVALVVQDGIEAVARALHGPRWAAVAFVAARLGASKGALRVWSNSGRGARRAVPLLADLVERLEASHE